VSTDMPLEQRLRTMYAVSVPTELDRRIERAITTVPIRPSGRLGRRRLAALAVAAIFAITAAGPAVEWFEGWNAPFDHLWEISTPVDQTVTSDGYRVTVHRAYADRLGVRLAMTVEDLDDRWSEFYVEAADVTDSDGLVYEGWNWSGSRTPVDGSSATWSRFLMPVDARGDDLQLRVAVTSLAVRSPDPVPSDLDPERVWTSVGGNWSFELHVPITRGKAISPDATVRASGVTIKLEELGVVPSGTVVRLAVEGLPEMPAGSTDGWYPVTSVEHDGQRLSDDPLEPGIGADGIVTLEVLPVEDLAGHWKIAILQFHSFDPASQQFGESQGPWVLEFDVAQTP
jgi:Domain of unknown function (DUF4179)